AQIAAILAHEGAHYVANHQLQKQQELKYIASGSDFFGYQRTRSYLSDYSKELELEADTMGFDRLVNAGYDTHEAARMFSIIAEETKAIKVETQNLYSTHPKLVERINNFERLSKEHDGFIGREKYRAKISKIIILMLQLNLSKYNYAKILFDLEGKADLLQSLPQTWYYLGEAYRQRNYKNDDKRSYQAYQNVLKFRPSFAPAYRAMGIHLMKYRHAQKARRYFLKYLELAPQALDRHYIEMYIQQPHSQVGAK
ncbi:MAG: M48 family metalloprotease, partial [Thiohalomonadales bacterium]